jgi:two-component system sensor histidine kinase RpfC
LTRPSRRRPRADGGDGRTAAVRPLPPALAALRGEVGSEREMSVNRLGFGLAVLAYLYTAARPIADAALPGLVLWGLLGFAIFAHIRFRPGRNTPRRAVALLGDMGVLSWFLHIGGEAASFFFLVYLWVIIGNGVRFGVRWLLAAMGVFLLGFGAVALTTPYWSEQPHLTAGLVAGPCVLALYAAVLIRKLSDARRQAEAASEAKSLFLASVSHELRTPLNAIIGMGGLLRETNLDREQSEMARTVDGAAKSLLSMINGILDFARIEAGAGVRRAEPLDLHALLEDVRRMLLAQAREKGLRLLVHATPRAPARVVGDEGHMRDVLLNLVGNAVKFTEAGEVVIAVDAAERPRAGPGADTEPGGLLLRFEVSDTGIGIAPDSAGRIFERFTQADENVGERFGGTGLGLAICKGLVGLLGGEIGVESEPGRGSTFWFTAEAERLPSGATAAAAARSFDGMAATLLTSDPAAGAALLAPAAARGAAVRVQPATRDEMERLWRPATDGEGAPPAHLLLCSPAADAPGPEALEALLREGVPASAGLSVFALGGGGGGAGGGLPPARVRRRVTSLLPEAPTPAELVAALELAATRLPRPAPQDAAPPAGGEGVSALRRPAAAGPPGGGLRVLVADDNQVNRRVVEKILQRAGHHATLVGNGEEALDALAADHFDVALMDVNMPVLNGIEATKLHRFASLGQRHVPIIGLTADASPATAERCREAGMDACLTKPVEPARLSEVVEAHGRPRGGDAAPAAAAPSTESDRVVAAIASHPGFRRAAPPPLDGQVLASLETLGGGEFVAGLVRDFLRDGEQSLRALEAAAGAGDVSRFRAEAHALRSSAANIGAKGVWGACRAAEALPAAEVRTAGPHQAGAVGSELGRVRSAWGTLAGTKDADAT